MSARNHPEFTMAGPGHPLVRRYLNARRRRGRQVVDVVALEGRWAIETALAADRPPEALYVCPPLLADDRAQPLIARAARRQTPVLAVTEKLFRRMVDRDGPDGLAALIGWRTGVFADIPVAADARVLVADRPERSGNLGSMIRCADGAGASGVLVTDSVVALSSHTVVKASLGTVFTLPTVATTTAAAMSWLNDAGFQIVAAVPSAPRSYRRVRYRPPVAVVVGNERRGLSTAWLEAADARVAIPMLGAADSLNVTTAAALLLYEALPDCNGEI